MKALLFGTEPDRDPPLGTPTLERLARSPTAVRELPAPELPGDDWVLVAPSTTGICGSDISALLLDADVDHPLATQVSLPHVPGHEIVGAVVALGSTVDGLSIADRVAIDPWLGCRARGLASCPACRTGDRPRCQRLTDGRFAAGMHLGVCSDLPGGFAEVVAAHASMCHPVPPSVDDDAAALADPFGVALRALLHHPPPAGGTVIVHGVGTIGSCTIAALRALHPGVRVLAVAREPFQAANAQRLGAEAVRADGDLVAAVAERTGGRLRDVLAGLPWLHPSPVDVVYDTVGAPETLAAGIRMVAAGGTVVVIGLRRPARFEWTPLVHKEVRLVGTSGYGDETIAGERRSAVAHYLRMASTGQVDVGWLVTHRYPLARWRDALATVIDHPTTGAVKVAIDPTPEAASVR